ERAFKAVHARWPNNADALHSLGLIERRLAHWDESVAYLRDCITLDPLVIDNHMALATTLSFRRDFAGASAAPASAARIWPDNADLEQQKVDYLQSIGALDRADAVLASLPSSSDFKGDLWIRRVHYAYRRQFVEGQRYFEGVRASPQFAAWPPFQRGFVE